jgi:hypothetical protein
VVMAGTVIVLVDGIGSFADGFGVAAPELAADRPAGVGAEGGGRRMLTL